MRSWGGRVVKQLSCESQGAGFEPRLSCDFDHGVYVASDLGPGNATGRVQDLVFELCDVNL